MSIELIVTVIVGEIVEGTSCEESEYKTEFNKFHVTLNFC